MTLLDFHPSPGSLYAGLCFHVYPVTVYFGYFLAGEQQFLHSGKYFPGCFPQPRNQWIRTNQQYGSDLAGSLAGVSGLMDTSRSLFSDNLSGLSPASHAQPPACPGTSPEVKKRKLQPSFHLACNDQHDLYQYSGCCSGSCPKRQRPIIALRSKSQTVIQQLGVFLRIMGRTQEYTGNAQGIISFQEESSNNFFPYGKSFFHR